jgi:hypothetical protein
VRRALLVVIFLPALAWAADVLPRPRLQAASPDGSRVAEIRARGRGGEAVWLLGRPAWPAPADEATPTIESGLAWSGAGDAVAFAARSRQSRQLVVVVISAGELTTVVWPVPREAPPLRTVTWLGAARVAAGPDALSPAVTASFRLGGR